MKDHELEQIEAKGIFTGSLSQVGQVFGIKTSKGWGRGKFTGTNQFGGYVKQTGVNLRKSRTLKRYAFVNMKTGREVILKSKLKIAGRIPEAENNAIPEGKG